MPDTLQSVPIWMMLLGFLLMLGPLVTLHELGHYWVGRWCGVKADVFSFGFGKELLGRTDKHGTRWRISLIPMGGYVQFKGDMSPASKPDPNLPDAENEGAFQSANLWQRTLIVAAGPVANLIIAVVILGAFALSYGVPTTPPVVQSFSDTSAAQAAGMELGDRITAIDGAEVETFQELSGKIQLFPGREVQVSFERDGAALSLPVTIGDEKQVDRFGNEARIGMLGVGSFDRVFTPVGPIEALGVGTQQSYAMMGTILTGIRQIVLGERSVKELGGPITMAKYSGERLSLGWVEFVYFIAFVSINLAFINLLPIPTLDGGHLAFYAVEAIRRKPASARSQEWAFRTGLAFVLALMVFVTIIDIAKLPIFGS